MQSLDGHDITPPITPLKSRRNKVVSPLNIEAATAHFRDAWTFTPPRDHDDLSLDALDTPPLSAASTSGELSAPIDAIHPLFGLNHREDVDDTMKDIQGAIGMMGLVDGSSQSAPFAGDVIGHPSGSDSLIFDNAPAIPPTPLLPSHSEFSPPRLLKQYQCSAPSDILTLERPTETRDSTPTSSSFSTPKANKKKRKTRRSGKARALGTKVAPSPLRASPSRQSSPSSSGLTVAGYEADFDDVFTAPTVHSSIKLLGPTNSTPNVASRRPLAAIDGYVVKAS